ncbi:MAG: ATP-binding protein [Pirellulaceae bacterium]
MAVPLIAVCAAAGTLVGVESLIHDQALSWFIPMATGACTVVSMGLAYRWCGRQHTLQVRLSPGSPDSSGRSLGSDRIESTLTGKCVQWEWPVDRLPPDWDDQVLAAYQAMRRAHSDSGEAPDGEAPGGHETRPAGAGDLVADLADRLAHELRNPLTTIKLLAQHAIQRHGGLELSPEEHQLLLEEVTRMEHIVWELNEFARPQDPLWMHTDLRVVLQETLRSSTSAVERQEIFLCGRIPTVPCVVLGDEKRLAMMLLGLIRHATTATAVGGRVDVELTEADDCYRLEIRYQTRDLGNAQSDDVFFRPLAHRASGCAGLLLAVCRRLAERHRGALTMTHHVERGTAITLELPPARIDPVASSSQRLTPDDAVSPENAGHYFR